jgi:hypothetical protein
LPAAIVSVWTSCVVEWSDALLAVALCACHASDDRRQRCG